jgi:hypothetical protein
MDNPNAFVGKLDPPSEAEVAAALGSAALLWTELIHWMAEVAGADVQEWKSYSPKSGWSLALKAKKRTIVWLGPCKGSFRVVFILGDKAVRAARQSHLPKEVSDLIEDAPRYPEGTGIRLQVRRPGDLPPVRKLAHIKAGV